MSVSSNISSLIDRCNQLFTQFTLEEYIKLSQECSILYDLHNYRKLFLDKTSWAIIAIVLSMNSSNSELGYYVKGDTRRILGSWIFIFLLFLEKQSTHPNLRIDSNCRKDLNGKIENCLYISGVKSPEAEFKILYW